MYDWDSIGIQTHGRMRGEIKTTCPRCSAERKKSREKCLSVNLYDGVYNCHHCNWSGKAEDTGRALARAWEKPRRVYAKPEYRVADTAPGDKLMAWFERRGIPQAVVLRNKIERREAWMHTTGKNEPVIAFPYLRDGEVVNVKYRTADKAFRMEKGAELCLYGLDDIEDNDTLIIVEGEIDKLSLEVAGFTNCVSVPNGADSDLDCLAADEARLAHIRKFILAVDADEKGQKLQAALISRLGRDRCWIADWPEGCKDANDALTAFGADAVYAAITDARPMPIEGVFEVADVRADVFDLYENGTPNGVHPGWDNLEELYRPRLGTWTAIIAIPGAGKTAWMAALMVNLAARHGWKFAVFPAENLPAAEYVSMLTEIYIGKPFNRGPNERMTRDELDEALNWLQEYFVILSPDDGERDLNSLLCMAKAYCLRRGINGIVIDPWNELEHAQPANQTETQYIGQSLIKIRTFAKTHNVHIWVVIHPTKLPKDPSGKYPVPTLYDAAGSAHWRNKADFGISLYRDYSDDTKPVEVHVQKVRWKWCGKIGMIELYFDKLTGRYCEDNPVPYFGEPRTKAERIKAAEDDYYSYM